MANTVKTVVLYGVKAFAALVNTDELHVAHDKIQNGVSGDTFLGCFTGEALAKRLMENEYTGQFFASEVRYTVTTYDLNGVTFKTFEVYHCGFATILASGALGA